MLPRRRKKERMGVRPKRRKECPAHVRWVKRTFDCSIAGKHQCDGPIDPHHLTSGEGVDRVAFGRSSDMWVVPLCRKAHDEGGTKGWKSFEARYKVDLTKIAADLWRTSPHGIKWRREHDKPE